MSTPKKRTVLLKRLGPPVLIFVSLGIVVVSIIYLIADSSLNAGIWVGFIGSILSALVGGLTAITVLRSTILHERKLLKESMQREEDEKTENEKRQIVNQRKDLADELAFVIDSIDLNDSIHYSEVRAYVRRAIHLVHKIDRTWECPDGVPKTSPIEGMRMALHRVQELLDLAKEPEQVSVDRVANSLKLIRNDAYFMSLTGSVVSDLADNRPGMSEIYRYEVGEAGFSTYGDYPFTKRSATITYGAK